MAAATQDATKLIAAAPDPRRAVILSATAFTQDFKGFVVGNVDLAIRQTLAL